MQVKIHTIQSIIVEPLDAQGNAQGSTHGFASIQEARDYIAVTHPGAEIIEATE